MIKYLETSAIFGGDACICKRRAIFNRNTRQKANAEIERLKKNLNESEAKLAEYELPNSPVQKISHKNCEAEMDKLRDQLVKQQNHIFKIDERLREQKNANRDLQSKLNSGQSDTKKYKQLAEKLKEKDARMGKLERDLEKAKAIVQEYTSSTKATKGELQKLRSENKSLQAENEELVHLSKKFQNETLVQAKEIMEKDKDTKSLSEQLEKAKSDVIKVNKMLEVMKKDQEITKNKPNKIENADMVECEIKKLRVKTDLGKRKRISQKEPVHKKRRISSRQKELKKWLKHRVEYKSRTKWLAGAVSKIISDTSLRLLLDNGKMVDVKIDQLQQSWRWEEDAFYEIEHVITQKYDRKRKKKLYKVRWKGFGKEDDSWVEEENLTKAALDEFLNRK